MKKDLNEIFEKFVKLNPWTVSYTEEVKMVLSELAKKPGPYDLNAKKSNCFRLDRTGISHACAISTER